MGARIEGVSTISSGRGLFKMGSLKLAVRSAKACLKKIGMHPRELDVLVNTGVYRDGNIGEPSIASFIQHDIKANIAYPPEGDTGTFGFDLSRGGCGMVSAMELIDVLIDVGSVMKGMVVASDAEPFIGQTQGFDYVASGASLVLGPGTDEEGFEAFGSADFPEYEDMFESKVVWKGTGPDKGKNVLVIKKKKAFMSRCVDCAQIALEGFMSKLDLNVKDIDLVIPSISPKRFAKKFRVRMGLRKGQVVDVTDRVGNVMSAGLAIGLDEAMTSGRFQREKTVLFVSVGAGICVSMALYKNPGPPSPEDPPPDPLADIFEEET